MLNLREWVLIGGVLCLTWLLLHTKRIFHRRMLARRIEGKHALDPFSMEIFEKTFTILVFFISSMLVLQILGLNIVPLLTFSGIGAAVIGFASRDVFANFFGGLMVYMTGPFSVGEYIELPEKKVAGTVEEVGWYLTSIRDVNKRFLYVPNSVFSTELLLNHSRITHRRIGEKIRIKNIDADQAQNIIEKIRQLLMQRSEIDTSEPIDVFLLSISPYGLEVEVKAYVKVTNYEQFMEIKQQILLEVYKIAFIQAVDVRT